VYHHEELCVNSQQVQPSLINPGNQSQQIRGKGRQNPAKSCSKPSDRIVGAEIGAAIVILMQGSIDIFLPFCSLLPGQAGISHSLNKIRGGRILPDVLSFLL